MEKLLRPKDKLLLGLALLTDIYFEIAEPLSVQLGKMKGVLPPNYKTTNFYNTLYRSLSTGEIDKVLINGQVYYQLSPAGKSRLIRKFPLIKLQQNKWDGLWRIVIFDICEKDKKLRNLLRGKLKELGFGMWQESVYISPFNVAQDMRNFLVSSGMSNQVYVLVARHLFAGDLQAMVSKIWNLDEINRQYESVIDDWEISFQKINKVKLKQIARNCYSRYLNIITQDPFLPSELLPGDWQGIDACQLSKKIVKFL